MTDRLMMEPVAWVRSLRAKPRDDYWGDHPAVLELDAAFDAEALAYLDSFSHLEVVYVFDRVPDAKIQRGARHPRNRQDWPKVGIFAQRGKSRPNRIGVSRCRVVRVEGRRVHVRDLDAIDGTPVIDIKPWFEEFAPRGDVHQPDWTHQLMDRYYLPTSDDAREPDA